MSPLDHICSSIDGSVPKDSPRPLEMMDIDELIGCTFDMPDEDGNMCKATAVDAVHDFEKSLLKDPLHAKFRTSLKSKKGECEEIIGCDQLLEHLEWHQ